MRSYAPVLVVLVGACSPLPPAVCTEGTSWETGGVAFEHASHDWGLDVLGADGVRLSAVDLDDDGYVDLIVRRTGNVGDDYATDTRTTWVLFNDQGKRFVDRTVESGLFAARKADPTRGRPGEIVAFADVDNDGDLDAFVALSSPLSADPAGEFSEVMLNDGTGHFSLGPSNIDPREKEDDSPAGASFTDIDRDGIVDLWMPRNNGQDRLYRGRGDGDFDDVTAAFGLTTLEWTSVEEINLGLAHSVSWSSVACDLNGDGTPELLSASYGRAPNHLWQGGEDGLFENRSVASGYAYDERQDWTDNESARCWCALHPTDTDCDGVPGPSMVCNSDADAFRWSHATDREAYRLGGNSGSTVCADVDGDGHLDLLTTEIVHWDVGSSSDPSEVLFNTGASDVLLERPGPEATGLVREHDPGWNDGDMTGAVFDFDNDGRMDIYIGSSDYDGTRGWLYHQETPRVFAKVPKGKGIDHTRSHGNVVADFDRDGDLDMVVGHSLNRCEDDCYDDPHIRMWENVVGEAGNWIQLRLTGVTANVAAIGARVEVETDAGLQVQEVGGGHGHYGTQHDLALHVGLGEACEATVTVRWPDGELSEDRWVLGAGHRYHLEQGGFVEVRETSD